MVCGPSSIFKASKQHLQTSLSDLYTILTSLYPTLTFLPPACYIGPTRLIQDNLPIPSHLI